ncbi:MULTISPECIES: RNA-directed DNA polymerase [Fusobacterium]|uniref:RNA-directed DNA polymerase n=1 Tax=Fusobacterium TaxID=848 RepID=UPI00044DB74A|nr:RNA-directed DNA polymerase [Fusobacterium sp. CM1]EUB34307.1 RNA-directed DNA polymerase [Fusobacterium sp. CM1]
MESISLEDIESAYLRLKRSIYYENNVLLHLKMKLVEFENEKEFLNPKKREAFFKDFKENLDIFDLKKTSKYFNELFSKIKYKKVIKKLNEKIDKNIYKIIEENSENEDLYDILEKKIKNDLNQNKISYNYFIDCPIELHIISVLWIMKIGYKLDLQLDREKNIYSYGYRLDMEKDNEYNLTNTIKEKSIFKRYPEQYQKWKNNGIKEVKHILEKNENAVIINLDLKKFYYHVNNKILKDKIKEIDKNILNLYLTKIILKINEVYAQKLIKEILKNKEFKDIKKEDILPIGLYSSAILANIYLKDLDDIILKETSPNYYGRYVDDLFLVFTEYNIEKTKNKKTYIIEKLKNILNSKLLDEIGVFFNENMLLTSTKQKLFILEKDKGEKELLEIEESILERASTFAFLPNEREIEKLYKKISIGNEEDEKNKKHDVSVYLAKLLMAFSNLEDEENLFELKNKLDEILLFFDEDNLIKYYMYYEKIFLLLIIAEDIGKIKKFYIRVINYFKKINEVSNIEEYLLNSFCFAISLNPILINRLKLDVDKGIIKERVKKIIKSNLFKDNLKNISLLNYTKFTDDEIFNFNFFKDNNFKIKENIELDDEKLILSPRFIHFSEFNNFYLKRDIISFYKNENFNFYKDSLEKFKLNYKRNLENDIESDKIFSKNITFLTKIDKLKFYKIISDKNENYKKIKIGVASLKIKENLKRNLTNGKIALLKKEEITEILNLAKINKVDILVFPEVSISYHWLGFLNRFSRENQILITGGLRHIFDSEIPYNNETPRYVFNFLFTILPFEKSKSKMSFMTLRLKNHYSPEEEKVINSKFYMIPTFKSKKYDIFSWKGLCFSNINCFELTDIEARSSFKNYIDLLIASVYNKDTYYFKNILESTCRDLHVFVAQSNTSIYGDCEILQPTNKDNMIMACIKGSQNNNLLIEEINIESLRDFQLQDYKLQKEENTYKITPPNINKDIVKLRKDNKLDEHFKEIEESKKE